MSFNWNFRREPDISNYDWEITPKDLSEIATEQMQGYRPNTALVPGSPVEQGIASMNGYTPNAQFSVPNYRHGGYAQPDLEGYGESLEAASEEAKKELQRQARIEELKSQIELVQNRINENIAKLNNFTGSIDAIASLEAEKINSTDPTTLWRWNVQRQDTKEANANTKEKAAAQFANTVDMWVNTRPAPTTEGIAQQISNINSAIRDGKNVGADVSRLVTKKEELEALIYGNDPQSPNTNNKYVNGTELEKLKADVEDTIAAANTSTEIAQYIENNRASLNPEQINKLNAKQRELEKKEKAAANEREFIAWVEKQTGKKARSLSDRTLKTYRNVWKNSRGK